MDAIAFIVCFVSLALFAQSLFSLYLMLYSWEHPERVQASKGPNSFLPPRLSFTVLLPARHEEAVIYETIKRVWAANYPSHLLEIVVICHIDDTGTIAEAERAIKTIGSPQVQIATFSTPPINKPHGLNVGLHCTRHQVVTIFDAEDDIHPDIFNVVNTVMLQEGVGIVQAGVQLMNFRDHWFAVHNCLEYFFWFKSRLHFHAKVGMIPLGGNTVFMRRSLIERVGGWDEQCLTEDADIGLRLSTLGVPIRVVYDAQHVTREETPGSMRSFVRQRTRWLQGFLQVLHKGTWMSLSRFSQRLLAIYTLSYPLFQAFLMLVWPLTIIMVLQLKVPVLAAMISFLPLYALLFQFVTTTVGAWMFAREYGLRFPLSMPISISVTFLPFQWLLGISAVRAVYRELSKQQNWEKTAHLGAHRKPEIVPSISFERLLPIVPKRAGVRLVPKPTSSIPAPASLSNRLHPVIRGRGGLLPVVLALLVGISLGTSLLSAAIFHDARSATPSTARLFQTHSSTSPRPTMISTPPPLSSTPAPLFGKYYGTIYDLAVGVTTTMSLTQIQESQGDISGYFTGLHINGSFSGLLNASKHIQFTVTDYMTNVPFFFDGVEQPDGTLAGNYCRLNQEEQCSGEYGIWSVIPATGGGS